MIGAWGPGESARSHPTRVGMGAPAYVLAFIPVKNDCFILLHEELTFSICELGESLKYVTHNGNRDAIRFAKTKLGKDSGAISALLCCRRAEHLRRCVCLQPARMGLSYKGQRTPRHL